MTTPLLQMSDIVKVFPGVRALDGVDLEVVAGEVHCLLGQNGAGKSTLIKVLSGAHHPDSGEVRWLGEAVRIPSPPAALRLGIATMYQELDLVDGLSVAENIFLGHEPAAAGWVRRSRMRREARALLARLGHGEIRPERELGELSAAGKQIVSMARALSHDVKLMIMDEPSAVLAQDEVNNLFHVIRELTGQGIAVVYISHRLDEIRKIGDRVTVLKDGRTVASGLPARDTPTADVVRLMTGRKVAYAIPPRNTPPVPGQPLLEVRGLSRTGELEDVSFTVQPGEIVGLAGLVGAGRSEILETIFGARRPTAGTILFDGRPLRPGSVHAAVAAGMGLAPEERKSQALLMDMSIAHNISLASLPSYSHVGWLDRGHELADAVDHMEALDLRATDPLRAVATLSGGNQQKVVVGRWLLKDCRLLLLDEPTRGVDVGARADIYKLIRGLADNGVGIVLVSSEVPEVIGLADRVLVIRDGRVIRECAATDIDESQVLDLVMEGSSL